MDKTLEDFTGILPQKKNRGIGILCNLSIIAGLLVMAICSLFVFSFNWNEVFAAGLLIIGGALLFGFGLLGRVLLEKN